MQWLGWIIIGLVFVVAVVWAIGAFLCAQDKKPPKPPRWPGMGI